MTGSNQPGTPSTFRLRRRTPGSFLLVPCPQQNRSIRCQGQLEAVAATILVACPIVAHIQEQPLTVWYRWRESDGLLDVQLLESVPEKRPKNRSDAGTSYIVPDFLIEAKDGQKRLVEIKASSRLARPIAQRKLEVARQYAAAEGWTFHLVTEKELHSGSLLANVRLINRYRQTQTDSGLLQDLQTLASPTGISLRDLGRSLRESDLPKIRTHVFHLLATGSLAFDPCTEAISDESLIYPKGTITWDPFDSVWAPSGC